MFLNLNILHKIMNNKKIYIRFNQIFSKKIEKNAVYMLTAFVIYFLIYFIYYKYSDTRNLSFVLIIIGFSSLNILLYNYLNKKIKKSIIEKIIIVISFLALAGLIILFFDWLFKINIFADKIYFRRYILALFFLQTMVLYLPFLKDFVKSTNENDNININSSLFYFALLYILFVIFLYTPTAVFSTAPDDFDISYINIILPAAAIIAILFFLFAIIYKLIGCKYKNFFTVLITIFSVLCFVYSYLYPGQYGSLNSFLLSNSENLYGNVYNYLLEYFILLIIICFVVVSVKKYNHIARNVLILLNIVAFLQFSYSTFSIYSSKRNNLLNTQKTENSIILPSYNEELMSFSKTGKNIIVLMLDMFSGGYMEEILQEDSEIEKIYEGFIWYPNTLSISYVTSSSIPSMQAGWKYTPDEINRTNKKNTLVKIIGDSYKILPEILSKYNYKSAYIDPDYCYTYRGDISELNKAGILGGFNKDYVEYWKNKNMKEYNNIFPEKNRNNELKLLLMVSIFKASPILVKPIIYDNGNWIVIKSSDRENSAFMSKIEYWSFIDSMPQISNINEQKNTYKFIKNSIAHDPFSLSKDGKLILGFPDPDAKDNFHGKNAYYSARGSLIAIGRWLSWLKESGIYDNTKIIIVSDHGNDLTQDPMMKKDFNVDGISGEEFNRIHALLMVKDFNKKGFLTIDNRFMSNADVPAIVCSDFDKKGDIISDPTKQLIENRVLKTMRAESWKWHYISKHTKFKFKWNYEVKNDMFESQNWEKVNY